jgi:hypothetical protein
VRLTGSARPRAVLAVSLVDTEAPNVVFGPATGTTAGEFFQIQYTSDEPLAGAELILADGRSLTLAVRPGTLEVLLPPDTADGWAAIKVWDAAGNERTYPAVVFLTGLPVVPPVGPIPAGGRPRRARPEPQRRLIRRRSRVLTSDRTVLLAGRWDLATGVASSRSRLRAELVTRERAGELGAAGRLAPTGRSALRRERGTPPIELLVELGLL